MNEILKLIDWIIQKAIKAWGGTVDAQIARLLNELLTHPEYTLRTFDTLLDQTAIFAEAPNDLRKLLISIGARKYKAANGDELWGFPRRNRVEKPTEPFPFVSLKKGLALTIGLFFSFGLILVGVIITKSAVERWQVKKLVGECASLASLQSFTCVAYDKGGINERPSGNCRIDLQAGEGRFFVSAEVNETVIANRRLSGPPAKEAVKPQISSIDGNELITSFLGSVACTNDRGTGRTCEYRSTVTANSYPLACVSVAKQLK